MTEAARRYGLLASTLVFAAYWDIVRDAPLSGAIVLGFGLLAFAIQEATMQHCATQYILYHRPEESNTAPIPVATQPADPRSEYEQYCSALAADDWAASECDRLLDQYDALPMCPVMDCPNKQSQCFTHRYFGLDYTPPVATEDKIKPAPAPRKRARKSKLSADAIANTALPVMLTLEA